VAASTVLLTGLPGLVAGALPMGAGEWISVRSQRELLTASTPGPGTHALVPHLDVDANELALVHRARGMPAEEAQQRADVALERQKEIFEPPSFEALDAVGSERSAALSSFAFFACGAAVPVLPLHSGCPWEPRSPWRAPSSGSPCSSPARSSAFSPAGRPPLTRALRQLAIGLGAAGITYAVGSLAGATIG